MSKPLTLLQRVESFIASSGVLDEKSFGLLFKYPDLVEHIRMGVRPPKDLVTRIDALIDVSRPVKIKADPQPRKAPVRQPKVQPKAERAKEVIERTNKSGTREALPSNDGPPIGNADEVLRRTSGEAGSRALLRAHLLADKHWFKSPEEWLDAYVVAGLPRPSPNECKAIYARFGREYVAVQAAG